MRPPNCCKHCVVNPGATLILKRLALRFADSMPTKRWRENIAELEKYLFRIHIRRKGLNQTVSAKSANSYANTHLRLALSGICSPEDYRLIATCSGLIYICLQNALDCRISLVAKPESYQKTKWMGSAPSVEEKYPNGILTVLLHA